MQQLLGDHYYILYASQTVKEIMLLEVVHLHLEIPMADSAVSRYLTPTYGQLEPIPCLASLNISQKVHIQIEFETLIK